MMHSVHIICNEKGTSSVYMGLLNVEIHMLLILVYLQYVMAISKDPFGFDPWPPSHAHHAHLLYRTGVLHSPPLRRSLRSAKAKEFLFTCILGRNVE